MQMKPWTLQLQNWVFICELKNDDHDDGQSCYLMIMIMIFANGKMIGILQLSWWWPCLFILFITHLNPVIVPFCSYVECINMFALSCHIFLASFILAQAVKCKKMKKKITFYHSDILLLVWQLNKLLKCRSLSPKIIKFYLEYISDMNVKMKLSLHWENIWNNRFKELSTNLIY